MPQRYRKRKIGGRTFLEHRLIAAEKLGRDLLPSEQAHHIDGNRFNNDPSNLEVVNSKEHGERHRRLPLTKPCEVCGREFAPEPTKRRRAKTCSLECRAEAISRTLQASPVIPPHAKLDKRTADAIRARFSVGGISMRKLAGEYGVHHSQISAIVRGQAWR